VSVTIRLIVGDLHLIAALALDGRDIPDCNNTGQHQENETPEVCMEGFHGGGF
jgi:hypothetical protein